MYGFNATHGPTGTTGVVVGKGSTRKGKQYVMLAPSLEEEDKGQWFDFAEVNSLGYDPTNAVEKAKKADAEAQA